MSQEETHPTVDDGDPESFLERWSRRKREARGAERSSAAEATSPPDQPTAAAPPVEPAAGSPAAPLPDIEQLDQDSDYRAFLAPGVDAELRRRALRKLFRGPKFNVLDGLDIYQDDFRSFEPLGGIVTADMRHQLEEAARRVAAGVEELRTDPPPAAAPAATAAAAPADETDAAATPPAEEDDDDDRRDA